MLYCWVLGFSQENSLNTDKKASFQFIENKNQWQADILFRADIPGGHLLIKKNSLQYVFFDSDFLRNLHPKPPQAVAYSKTNTRIPDKDVLKGHSFAVNFVGSNSNPTLRGLHPASYPRNYFYGNKPENWATQVKGYDELLIREIYPHIDLRFYTHYQTLKYEFIVRAGGDAAAIQMQYEGMEKITLEDYNLLIKTSVNLVVETRPYCYQLQEKNKVPADFRLTDNTVSFHFPKGYDKKNTLVIDPTLVFSTFSGSNADNWAFTATYDTLGNLYSGGIVLSAGFPATTGAFQQSYGGGITDVAILKFSPDGKRLLYASYLGGENTDIPHSLITNANNELYIMGTTSSNSFPTTTTAFDRTFNRGTSLIDGSGSTISGLPYSNGSDIFIAKINPDGSRLLASTYLGGSNNDGLNNTTAAAFRNYGDQFRGEIALDSLGFVYVASVTFSPDFPVRNASQAVKSSVQDGFVAKFRPDLSDIDWATFLGGNNHDAIYGMKVNKAGKIYVCGATRSTNLPTSAGTLKTTIGGSEDGFVAIYENNLLTKLTYLGTSENDQAYLLDLDSQENIYVLGLTFGNYPVTAGVYSNAGGGQFIHALSNDLTTTILSTRIGSGNNRPNISPTSFLVNDCGNVYLAGWGGNINTSDGTGNSSTNGLPVTADAFKATTNGDDFYFVILEKGIKSLLYATFFGENSPARGNHVDGGTCRFDKRGIIYHAACACGGSSGFPTTPGVVSNRN
ncbi:MAG: PKD domain-containing protein, partial [Verrucomicrobia bacterium]|nr:PKD domain-containing protein [Cytophagales bacterium]